jgi:mono/diheme cytochrome c family protein
VRPRWLFIVFGPALLSIIGSVIALIYLPHPVPKTATPVQRLYLSQCASCHGANGGGSWRATLFLMRPGDLADPRTFAQKTDQYLFDLIKNGGATIGKPGMPAFGFHLTDDQMRELVAYVRALPEPARAPRPARTPAT